MSLSCKYFFFIAFTVLCNSWHLGAQEDMKYKDIFNSLQTGKKEEIFPALMHYQSKNPFFSNTYYQLGLISDDWARSYDPLIEYNQVVYFIYNAKLYYGLARHYLDEKQARRYAQYFQKAKLAPGKNLPGLKEIQEDIDERLNNIRVFEQHLNRTYLLFTRSARFYNKCVDIFMDICRHHNMLKEIYLTASDSLLQQTSILKQSYDSSLIYFSQYRKAVDSFPLKNYHQDYFLRPILTYRLDGLTGSDFARDTIQLWNYGSWVNDLNQILNTEIKDLRNRIDTTGKQLGKAIAFFQNNPLWFGSELKYPEPDRIMKNKLGKIDFGSVVLNLFNFKENFIRYLVFTRDSLNDPSDTIRIIPFTRRSKFYADLAFQKEVTDSLLMVFSNTAIESNINKYRTFFHYTFPGPDDIRKYCQVQKDISAALLDKAFSNLSGFLVHSFRENIAGESLPWKKTAIPTKLNTPSLMVEASTDLYLTFNKKVDRDHNLYLTGSFIPLGKKPLAFVAFAERGKKVIWVKTINLSEGTQDLDDFGISIDLRDNGCYVMVNSINPATDTGQVINTLVKYDLKGNELIRTRLGQGSMVRWMLYDEINNRIYAAFHGRRFNSWEDRLTDISICEMDSTGVVIWNYSAPLEGNLTDIVRMDENWLVFCNASRYITESNAVILKDGKNQPSTGIISLILGKDGKLEKSIGYNQFAPARAVKVVKLSSESINILGFHETAKNYPGSSFDNPGKLMFLLIDQKGRLVYGYY